MTAARVATALLATTAAALSVAAALRPAPSWPAVDLDAPVVLIGDCITAWWPDALLVAATGRAGPGSDGGPPCNLGVSGYRVHHALAQVSALRGSSADVVVVALGTNDLTDGTPTWRIARDLRTLVDDLRAVVPLAAIVVVTPAARLGAARDDAETLRRRLYTLEGPGVVVLDVPWDPPSATFDGIHPTPTGYRLYADILGPVVRARRGR